MLNRLRNQNALTLTETMTSLKEYGIKPDEDTKLLMEVARSDGRISAVGYDGDLRLEESTDPHPLLAKDQYDHNEETVFSAMLRIAREILGKLGGG